MLFLGMLEDDLADMIGSDVFFLQRKALWKTKVPAPRYNTNAGDSPATEDASEETVTKL